MARVTTIPATISRFTATPINEKKKRRTAAYARVSTDSEEQLTSYTAQVDYYTIPSLESRLTSDTYNVHNFISRIQRLGIRAPILLTGGIIITLILEPVLASVLIFTYPSSSPTWDTAIFA